MSTAQITPSHLARKAAIYIRQSSPGQVLHNRESQRLQYGLVDRAVNLGWPRSQVTVIDDDLGVSGRGGGITRIGFERLVAEVGLGHIGIVFSIEVSRVARNNREWYHLLDLCALVDTLIADADGLYHPAVINDRLLLGLKGTISEFELHLIRSRLNGGLWEAARRGELRTHLPMGYEYDREGRLIKVADEAIRETISLILAKFAELGSARQVTTYLAEEGVLLPHRRVDEDLVNWRRATFGAVHDMLTNPTYAGVYGYGRSKVERRLDEAGHLRRRQVTLPLNEWAVFIPNHHESYIPLAVFEANQARLRANWRAPRGAAGDAVREGSALLQSCCVAVAADAKCRLRTRVLVGTSHDTRASRRGACRPPSGSAKVLADSSWRSGSSTRFWRRWRRRVWRLRWRHSRKRNKPGNVSATNVSCWSSARGMKRSGPNGSSAEWSRRTGWWHAPWNGAGKNA
jgi:DNA invertase Pin-like site-specific DNA recombinase